MKIIRRKKRGTMKMRRRDCCGKRLTRRRKSWRISSAWRLGIYKKLDRGRRREEEEGQKNVVEGLLSDKLTTPLHIDCANGVGFFAFEKLMALFDVIRENSSSSENSRHSATTTTTTTTKKRLRWF